MELGDFEPANEFEFDLSDVDVAAFESVATEDTAANSAQQQDQHHQQQHQQIHQQQHDQAQLQQSQQNHQEEHHELLPQDQQQMQDLDQPQLLQQQQQQQPDQQLHLSQQQQQLQTRKILLVPINSKPGQHFIQLPAGTSPITMGTIQLAPINMASSYSMPKKNEVRIPQSEVRISQNEVRTVQNEVPKRRPCNCTKSQCLKLYCDCFANGEFCSSCNCTNCFNSLSKEKERQKAVAQCLERNPEAFRPKIGKAVKSTETIERRHTKGCNCKRSGCLKNYCECYEAKILCSNLCKCCGCKNYDESFERKSLMQMANSVTENARGILKNLLPTNTSPFSSSKDFNKKYFINDKVIRASLTCLMQTAQQAEKDGVDDTEIQNLLHIEMGKCLKMIVESAAESSSPKKR